MNYCPKCGLPNIKNIPFNEAGECYICENWDDYKLKVKEDFSALLDKVREKGSGKPFDCVVGISGGRDSTYLLYKLTQDYDLRCAAVFVENAFTPPETVENVRKITDKLNVKLFHYKIDAAYHMKIARKMIRYWQRTGNPIFSNLACAPCKLFNKYIFKLANQLKINTIIYGGNPYEIFYLGPGDTSKSRKGKFTFFAMLKDTFSKIARGVILIFSNLGIVRYLPIIIKASVMYVNQYSPYLKLRYPKIISYDFFHHYDWNEAEMNSILKKLGWILPEGFVSTWRADCYFEEVKNYMFKQTVGISHIHSLFSNLAREGKIPVEESIKRSQKEAFSSARLNFALEKLSLKSLEADE